jgi:alanyl aminopeptidase
VWPVSYELALDVDPRRADFNGHARIEVQLERRVDLIQLHARDLRISRVSLAVPGSGRSVTASPQPLPGRLGENGLTSLVLAEPIGPGTSVIDLEYSGEFNGRLRGLYKVETGGESYAFTQFEPIDARRAFPCFDEPRFKTPFQLTLRVPVGERAVSNTPLEAQRDLDGGQSEVRFARTEKLPTYLVALAVGPLDVVEAPPIAASAVRPQPLPLRGVSARGRGPELAFALKETPALVESLERYFGVAYPYPKLDLIAVPDFAAGAMENAGAITFRDTLLLLGDAAPEGQRRASVSVNAHELGHQWFGDLVTMPWWDDTWLNEGFATWLAGRVVQDVHPEYKSEFARVAGLERAFDVDGRRSARQVRQPIENDHDIRNAFDAITYTKGGALLAMFERYLGAEAFRAGLRLYLERHRFGNGTSVELLQALEQASGQPVTAAFSSFLDQPGAPSIAAQLECVNGAAPRVHLRQQRFAPLGSGIEPGGRWQVPVCVRYAGSAAEGAAAAAPGMAVEQCTLLSAAEADLELTQRECPAWLFPNSRASGYYRWSLGASELSALLERGYASLDAAERLSLLANAEAAARSGTQSFAALMAVVRQVASEPERELASAALGVLARSRDALLHEAELPGYRRVVRELTAARQKKLGLFPGRGEDGETKLLRAELTSALAFEARDASVRSELEALGRAHLGLARDARAARLPSEITGIALAVAVQAGGKAVIERARAALGTSTDGVERARLLSALGSNQNPELSPLVLEVALADELRTNERLPVVFGQLQELETRQAAYDWIEQHFDVLVARVGNELGAQLTRAAGAFCSAEQSERARRFFEPRAESLTGGPRLLRLSVEGSEACAAYAAAQRQGAREYFSSPSRAPAKRVSAASVRERTGAGSVGAFRHI